MRASKWKVSNGATQQQRGQATRTSTRVVCPTHRMGSDFSGFCHAHSNCRAIILEGKPWMTRHISQGRFFEVFQAPPFSSPLCWRMRCSQPKCERTKRKHTFRQEALQSFSRAGG